MLSSGCERRKERERKGIREVVRERLVLIQNSGFFFFLMLTPNFLHSLHDSNPLLLTGVVNIKQRTVNSITQASQAKVSPILQLIEFPIFRVFYYS